MHHTQPHKVSLPPRVDAVCGWTRFLYVWLEGPGAALCPRLAFSPRFLEAGPCLFKTARNPRRPTTGWDERTLAPSYTTHACVLFKRMSRF